MSKHQRITERYFETECPESLQGDFTRWITDPQEADEKEHALRGIWDRSAPGMNRKRLDRSFARVKAKIKAGRGTGSKTTPVKRFMRIAAVLLLPLLAAGITFLNMDARRGPVSFSQFFVPNTHIDETVLPDGTIVKLNSGSTLLYPKKFQGPTREVFLNGEAVFTVSKTGKPLIVQTADVNIEVLGTVFNVSAYSDGDRTEVTLQQGKVRATLNDGSDRSFILTPGQQLGFYKSTAAVIRRDVDAGVYMAWTESQIILDQMPVEQIAKLIERKYGVMVYYNSAKYANESISAKFRHGETLEQLLEVLEELIPGFRYKFEDGELFIY